MATEANTVQQIKKAIRHCRTEQMPAAESAVKRCLREWCDDDDRALDMYERLRKQGEIYSYPTGNETVVKITEDQI